MKWVFAGLLVGLFGSVASTVLLSSFFLAAANPTLSLVAGFVNMLALVTPVTVAYAVLNRRVVDIRFALGRALVVGVLTTFAVALFSLIEWYFGKRLEASRLGSVVEIVAAVALGLSFKTMHQRIDLLIDALFFRSRRIAEERLKRLGAGLPHAVTEFAVSDAIVREPVEALELTSGALFLREASGDYALRSECAPERVEPRVIRADDAFVLHLQGAAGPVRLDQVGSAARTLRGGERGPVIAIPIFVRRELIAAAFFGAHRSGAALDTDEVLLLANLCVSAGFAYEHVEAMTLRERVAALTLALEHTQGRTGQVAH